MGVPVKAAHGERPPDIGFGECAAAGNKARTRRDGSESRRRNRFLNTPR